MRRLLIIPGLLFGLLFAAGGFFILSETAWPMWQKWQRAQDWRPASARLLSMSGADNDTRVTYGYDFAGGSYRGTAVGISEFKDNIGSYHQDMQAYLREIRRNEGILPIWVNPAIPSQAVIDRDMRWGLFALTSGFCSIFLLIGLGVMYASLRGSSQLAPRRRPSLWQMRKSWQQAQKSGSAKLGLLEFCRQHYAEYEAQGEVKPDNIAPSEWRRRKGWGSAQIYSAAGRGVWFFWIFALVWNAISAPILFIPIYQRHLQRDEISHLSIKRSGSTGQGVDKIEHFKIRAQDKKGGNITLAEDIDGEDVATHLRDYLAQRIVVAVR